MMMQILICHHKKHETMGNHWEETKQVMNEFLHLKPKPGVVWCGVVWCGGVWCGGVVVSVCVHVRVQLIKDDRKMYPKLLVRLFFTFRHLTPSICNFGFHLKIHCKI